MTSIKDLARAQSDNMHNTQFGRPDDGITPEAAKELGYATPEEFAEIVGNLGSVVIAEPVPVEVSTEVVPKVDPTTPAVAMPDDIRLQTEGLHQKVSKKPLTLSEKMTEIRRQR